MLGHDASDVLRELVQNEYDGGGDRLRLEFADTALTVTGNGRGIGRDGWSRLSVIVGTGRVMGEGGFDRIEAKQNGIGSKNFGLRSLFIFGDEIYVRSRGRVALLDLKTQETGNQKDPDWSGVGGVQLHVGFRDAPFEKLEPFTAERERRAFDLMAARMPATLVKLALGGKRSGLRDVMVTSARVGRSLEWRQDATAERCRVAGVTAVSRTGRMVDRETGRDDKRETFQEIEFARAATLPAVYVGRDYPAYYRIDGERIRIAVSLPIQRRKVDLGRAGHFYYPLQTPDSRTGCVVSVSAPFDLNNDRSSLTDSGWNEWLIDRAVEMTLDLLKEDWVDRFGADAFKALTAQGWGHSSRFLTQLQKRLAEDACWPTRAKGEERFVAASALVLPDEAAIDGFLADACYLDPRLAGDAAVEAMARTAGAPPFTLSSFIRLRCAGEDSKALATKIPKGLANFHYKDFATSLGGEALQVKFGEALSILSRKLGNPHRTDLGTSPSTLSATGGLKPAKSLVLVAPEIWEACPEPRENRLHPSLAGFRPIAIHCREFDEEQWLIDAAGRAANAADDDPEREALYAKLLSLDRPIGRRALAPLRANPVVRNQRGAWVAPAAMTHLRGRVGKLLAPYIDAPSRAMLGAPKLMASLRIRDTLNGADLVRFASGLATQPKDAAAFEKLLADNLTLLTRQTVAQLKALACLQTRSGKLAKTTELHLDTLANRICIGEDDKIVAAGNDMVHRRLGVREVPDADTLLAAIQEARERDEAPARPDLIYPALVTALQRDGRDRTELSLDEICWVAGAYHAPANVLVGARHSQVLEHAVAIYKRYDEIGAAFTALGAPTLAGPEHWARFFRHASQWPAPLDAHRQRILLEAYHQRGLAGLPDGLGDVACLVDQQGRLFTRHDLTAGQLVEPDFPLLEKALTERGSTIGLIVRRRQAQSFFTALRIRPLSAIVGAGKPIFGTQANAPFWFKPHHRDGLLAMLRKPIFARALHEIARMQRHAHPDFTPIDQLTLRDRIDSVGDIRFLATIARQYTVGGATVEVPVDIALSDTAIGIVPPRNKLDFQMLLAEALAEIAGATTVALARSLANAFLPLVLCPTSDAMRSHLDRIGIDHARWGFDEEEEVGAEEEDEFAEAIGEEALRQMMHGLNVQGGGGGQTPSPTTNAATSPPPTPTPPSRPPPPPPLPPMDDVVLSVAATKGALIERRQQGGGGGGYSGYWMPRTPTEAARDAEVGRRGEQLIYRMELDRVRALGHENPESVVIWTSLAEPGADHDIRSIDADGQVKWIEVKATTGVDGRFDWSRKEFEKALRERERYELWRVYRAAEKAPIAKCFPNPAQLIGQSRIVLELGTMRANIENLG